MMKGQGKELFKFVAFLILFIAIMYIVLRAFFEAPSVTQMKDIVVDMFQNVIIGGFQKQLLSMTTLG